MNILPINNLIYIYIYIYLYIYVYLSKYRYLLIFYIEYVDFNQDCIVSSHPQKIFNIIELIAKYVNFLSIFSHSNERQYAIVIYCEL